MVLAINVWKWKVSTPLKRKETCCIRHHHGSGVGDVVYIYRERERVGAEAGTRDAAIDFKQEVC